VIAVGHAEISTAFGSEGYNAGIALFVLLDGAFSEWVAVGVLLLALVLVMSTTDTLFNALSSVVTTDLPRLLDDPSDRTLRFGARTLTVLVAIAAIAVSLRARSVLRLFFVADLLGAAVAVPLVYGLFNARLSGTHALVSSLVGLAVGGVVFPFPFGLHGAVDSLLGGVLPAPDPTYLLPFAGAFLVSTALTLLFSRSAGEAFDLDRLAHEIHTLDGEVPDGGDAMASAEDYSSDDDPEVTK
jgi:Na+/proline symporter